MSENKAFEFRRTDGVFYRFSRLADEQVSLGYVRSDGAVHVVFDDVRGWVVRELATGELVGIPWDLPVSEQHVDRPPKGDWVSKKDKKSYVYELIYVGSQE